MLGLFGKMKGSSVDEEDRRVLAAIAESGIKSMKVVGRGTLMVDPVEVAGSDLFKGYAKKAKKLVEKR